MEYMRFLGTGNNARAIERFATRHGHGDAVQVNMASLAAITPDGLIPLKVGQCVVIDELGELIVTAPGWRPRST
jgi:hypothetical protein